MIVAADEPTASGVAAQARAGAWLSDRLARGMTVLASLPGSFGV